MFSATGYLFIRDVVVNKAYKHEHQRHEDQYAEERVQNASHLRRTEGLRQPLQSREEKEIPDNATVKKQITTVQ